MKDKNSTRKILISVLLLFFLLTSSAFSATKKWTIMVYLAADNNLEESAIDDFLEMSNVGSDDNIDILVQLDRISGYDSRYGNWTICHRFYVTQNMEPSEDNAISDWGDGKGGGREVNMGSKETLTNFVKWGVENYPAEKYAIILWNHGSGWKSLQEGKLIFTYKEICWDYSSSNDSLTMKEVRQALKDVEEYIHLIGFDACLMGMLEVATEIKSLGEVMVASEETEPISGWNFEGFLTSLKNNPSMSAQQLGTTIVETYINHGDVGNYGKTLSAIDLTKISDFNSKFDTLLQKLITLNTEWLNIYISRQSTQVFDTREFLDIKDFLENLSANSYNQEIISLTQETINSFDSLVIKNYSANGYNANGLSIYFPAHSGPIDKDYRSGVILFAGETLWKSFLQSFVSADIFSGYTRIYQENFTFSLPSNWSIIDGYQDGKTWGLKSDNSYSSYLTLPYMVVDSDAAGSVDMDEQLISELYDFDKYSIVYLSFNHFFKKYKTEKGDVDIKVGSGNWQTLKRYQGSDAEGKVFIDITSFAAGQKDVKIRWRYYDANFDWYWAVDDVEFLVVNREPLGVGDINSDGSIDISDVILSLRISIGLDITINSTTYQQPYSLDIIELADMNEDGWVNISDVILILRRSLNLP